MKFQRVRQILILLFFQSVVAFVIFFLDRSEQSSSIVLWFSKSRLIVVVAFMSLLLIQGALTLYFAKHEIFSSRLLIRLEEWLIHENLIISLIIIMVIGFLLGVSLTILIIGTPNDFLVYGKLAPTTFPTIKALVKVLLPIIVNGLVTLSELTILLALFQRSASYQLKNKNKLPLGPIGIFFLVAITLFHWCVLIFRLRIFVNHPAWYWEITSNPFSARDGLFLLILSLVLFCIYVFRKQKQTLGIIGLILLTLSIQFTIGYLGGNGLTSLQDRLFTTYHSEYARSASESSQSLLETVRNYEALYGNSMFTSTKPPGLMVFYQVLERIINGQPAANGLTTSLRYERMKWLITIFFPILACGTPLLMIGFSKRFFDLHSLDNFWKAPILLVMTPNFVLFALFADQALYPGLFLLGVWTITTLLQKQSNWLAFLIGVLLYWYVFFAFTMLPLFMVAAFYLLILFWTDPQKFPLKKQIMLGISLILGVIVMHLIGRWLLNYDVIQRFTHTMAINHRFDFYTRVGLVPIAGSEPILERLMQIARALWINFLDYGSSVGFALWSIFLFGAGRLLIKAARKRINSFEIILVSMILSFIVMNLAGTAQGEVARLWLFWLPMVIWVVLEEVQNWRISQNLVYLTLLVIQVVTTLLTFHFQDLHM